MPSPHRLVSNLICGHEILTDCHQQQVKTTLNKAKAVIVFMYLTRIIRGSLQFLCGCETSLSPSGDVVDALAAHVGRCSELFYLLPVGDGPKEWFLSVLRVRQLFYSMLLFREVFHVQCLSEKLTALITSWKTVFFIPSNVFSTTMSQVEAVNKYHNKTDQRIIYWISDCSYMCIQIIKQ